jgi:uncharacterized protein
LPQSVTVRGIYRSRRRRTIRCMDFDRLTISLLILREDGPELSPEDEEALQDAHMAHLADLHEAGQLLAAGPVLGDPGRRIRGFSILRADPDEALSLEQEDPGVKAGRWRVEIHPWIVPAGAMSFSPTRFPRSMAEAEGD